MNAPYLWRSCYENVDLSLQVLLGRMGPQREVYITLCGIVTALVSSEGPWGYRPGPSLQDVTAFKGVMSRGRETGHRPSSTGRPRLQKRVLSRGRLRRAPGPSLQEVGALDEAVSWIASARRAAGPSLQDG